MDARFSTKSTVVKDEPTVELSTKEQIESMTSDEVYRALLHEFYATKQNTEDQSKALKSIKGHLEFYTTLIVISLVLSILYGLLVATSGN